MKVTPRVMICLDRSAYTGCSLGLLLGRLMATLVLLASLVWSCVPPLDTTRSSVERRSAGELIYEELCNRVSSAADRRDVSGQRAYAVCHNHQTPPAGAAPRLQALHAQHPRFVHAVDTALQAPHLATDLKDFLSALVPLYDNGLMDAQRQASITAVHALRRDSAATTALGRISGRHGYSPVGGLPTSLGTAVLQYPQLDALIDSVFAAGARYQPLWLHFQRAVQDQLQTDPTALLLTDATAAAALHDFLLTPIVAGAAPAQWIVVRDPRGMPLPVVRDGMLPAPLVDCDHDGLATANAAGQFTDCADVPLQVGAPFAAPWIAGRNAVGQLLTAQGEPFFHYADLGQSALRQLLMEARQLAVNPPGAPAWLDWAPRVHAVLQPLLQGDGDAAEARPVYNPAGSVWVDVAGTLGWLIAQGDLPEFLDVVQRLAAHHETELAAALNLVWQAYDWALEPNLVSPNFLSPSRLTASTLADDLTDVAVEIAAIPGLLGDILAALQDPNTQHLGHLFAQHMLYRDRIDFDPADINGPPLGSFVTAVDRDQPDSGDNSSLMQRLVHLVHDAQQPMCNLDGAQLSPFASYARCDMFKIDNAALFYLQAILGEARFTLYFKPEDEGFLGSLNPEDMPGPFGLADVHEVEHATECVHPISGDARICMTYSVGPAAAARFLFVPFATEPLADPAGQMLLLFSTLTEELRADGQSFTEVHRATLFAWELDHFFESVTPVLRAFARHGRAELMLHFLNVLHRHWASLPSNPTGIVRFEPYLARLLDDQPHGWQSPPGAAFTVQRQLLAALGGLQASDGRDGVTLAGAVAEHLLSPQFGTSAAAPQHGHVPRHDGQQRGHLAAWHVLTHALHVAPPPAAQAPGDAAMLQLMRHFLTVQPAANDAGLRLVNREAYALVPPAAAAAQKILAPWSGQAGLPDLWRGRAAAILSHPLLASTVQLAAALSADPALRPHLAEFAEHLCTEHFAAVVAGAAAALQQLPDAATWEPLLRASALLFAPETGLASVGVHVLEHARRVDHQQVLPRLLPNLVVPMPLVDGDTETPLDALIDIYAQVNRREPGSDAPLGAADFAADDAVLGTLETFMLDADHGMGRLLQLVDGRHGRKDGSL